MFCVFEIDVATSPNRPFSAQQCSKSSAYRIESLINLSMARCYRPLCHEYVYMSICAFAILLYFDLGKLDCVHFFSFHINLIQRSDRISIRMSFSINLCMCWLSYHESSFFSYSFVVMLYELEPKMNSSSSRLVCFAQTNVDRLHAHSFTIFTKAKQKLCAFGE